MLWSRRVLLKKESVKLRRKKKKKKKRLGPKTTANYGLRIERRTTARGEKNTEARGYCGY